MSDCEQLVATSGETLCLTQTEPVVTRSETETEEMDGSQNEEEEMVVGADIREDREMTEALGVGYLSLARSTLNQLVLMYKRSNW